MHSDPFFGKIAFRKIRNAATGERVPNRYIGRDIPCSQFIRATRPVSLLARAGKLIGPLLKQS